MNPPTPPGWLDQMAMEKAREIVKFAHLPAESRRLATVQAAIVDSVMRLLAEEQAKSPHVTIPPLS